jgi:hypothetical protein
MKIQIRVKRHGIFFFKKEERAKEKKREGKKEGREEESE